MDNLDDIIKPDNLGENGIPEKVNKGERKEKPSATRNRLDALKELLKSDSVTFDSNSHMPQPNDFPASSAAKMINYDDEDEICLAYAEATMSAIIENYIKSEELLNSVKLKSIKALHVNKLAELQMLVRNSKRNMIMMQEGIDAGDMSKDMFNGVREYQVEMRTNIEHRSKHVDKCELYWENYAVRYGMENKEEEIMRKAEVKEDKGEKMTIISQSDLNKAIADQMQIQQEKMDKFKSDAIKNNE